MATIARYRCQWTGAVTGPSVSTFYYDMDAGSADFGPPLRTFWNAIRSQLPPSVTITLPTTADLIDPLTGNLTGANPSSPGAPVTGSGSTNFSVAAGALVQWKTGAVSHKHRVEGRTFLVPFAWSAGNTGIIPSGDAAPVIAAANALIAAGAGAFGVWSRPVTPAEATATVPARVGSFWPIVTANVPNKMCVLRSRRD